MKESKALKHSVRIGQSLVVFALIYLLSYLMNPYGEGWQQYYDRSFLSLIEEFIASYLLSWAIIETSIWIAKILDKKLSWTGSPILRFSIQVLLVIVVVVVVIYIQDLYFIWSDNNQSFSIEKDLELWHFFVVSVIISILVSAVHTGYFFLQRWKLSMSETAELKIKTLELKEVLMQAELQSLKHQLDPHFMFNNFSTLSELINEDQKTASEFLDNLARVYRYMILNLKKDLIALSEELAFVKAYIFLIKIRYGDNVVVNLHTDEKYLSRHLPPISIQLLIENATKHNRATASSPLILDIWVDKQTEELCVKNNLQRIQNPLDTTKVGLNNIFNRYTILSSQIPKVIETTEAFEVRLPLLN
jgi:two-component system LytT family sensor kinase